MRLRCFIARLLRVRRWKSFENWSTFGVTQNIILASLLYTVLGTSLLWRSTVARHLLKKVKSAKCLCLLLLGLGPVILVLVLRIWSCLHHWYRR